MTIQIPSLPTNSTNDPNQRVRLVETINRLLRADYNVKWTGTATFTSPVLFADGTVSLPSITFASDLATGIWHSAVNTLDFTIGGVNSLQLIGTALILGSNVQVRAADGSAGTPSLSFSSNTNLGIYRASSNTMGFSAGGLSRFTITTNAITCSTSLRAASGAANLPSISFTSATDTGFYWDTAGQIGIGLGGTTAGQIAQGSFTATFTGMTATTTATLNYFRVGRLVCLYNATGGSITGTSNSAAMTITGIPAICRPTSLAHITQTTFVDNGGALLGTASVDTAGTLTCGLFITGAVASRINYGTSTFTASGSKGVLIDWQCIYAVD